MSHRFSQENVVSRSNYRYWKIQSMRQRCLRCAAELMDGLNWCQSFVESIENVVYSSSDTGAMLSAFRRSKSIEVGDLRLIHTSCGTLEGRVCSSLIGIGADVAMAVRHRDRTTRITARASKKGNEESGFILE